MKIGNKIRSLRIENNLSQDELAKKVGYSNRSVISTIESNTRDFPREKLEAFSKALNVPVSFLCGEDTDNIKMHIIGEVSAGYGGEAILNYDDDFEYIPSDWVHNQMNNYILLKVRGDSMADKILDGDLVLVRKQPTCESGQLAVCFYDDEYASIKEIKYNKDFIYIIPYNKKYPIKRIKACDLKSFMIIGVVVNLFRSY